MMICWHKVIIGFSAILTSVASYAAEIIEAKGGDVSLPNYGYAKVVELTAPAGRYMSMGRASIEYVGTSGRVDCYINVQMVSGNNYWADLASAQVGKKGESTEIATISVVAAFEKAGPPLPVSIYCGQTSATSLPGIIVRSAHLVVAKDTGGPPGPKGDTGPQGPKGDSGPPVKTVSVCADAILSPDANSRHGSCSCGFGKLVGYTASVACEAISDVGTCHGHGGPGGSSHSIYTGACCVCAPQ